MSYWIANERGGYSMNQMLSRNGLIFLRRLRETLIP
jgi:hypothetical protein